MGNRVLRSEVDAAAAFFPVAVAGGLKPLAPTVLGWRRRRGDAITFRRRGRGFRRRPCWRGLAKSVRLWKHPWMLSTRSPTFKQAAVNTHPLSLLGDAGIVRLAGPDAEAFAQSQFMNDVLALDPGQWQWSGWLSPKGRVRALFALARRAPGELLLVLLDHPTAAFCEALQRFVFRSRLRITDEHGLAAFAEWPEADPSPGPRDRLLVDGGAIGLDLSAAGGARRCWIAARGDAQADEAATRRWRLDDLRHGLPRWPAGVESSWTPHMLSLDRLNAFSLRKGCYPGQEIVARTHFLGQSKRQAWWLEGEGLAAQRPVEDGTGRIVGEIIAAADDGRSALAVAAIEVPAMLRCGESTLSASAPQPGLARPN